MNSKTFGLVLLLAVASWPAAAQQGAVRWSARACGARAVRIAGQQAEATLLGNGKVQVRIVDPANDALIAERVVDPPTWRTRAGADCTAMGIAGAELTRVGRTAAVKVEISVGDLCERNAPRCAVVTVP